MTRLRIHTIQSNGEEKEESEVYADAVATREENAEILKYILEDGSLNELSIYPNHIELNKTGEYYSEMVFDPDRITKAEFIIDGRTLEFDVDTQECYIDKTDRLHIKLKYTLSASGSIVSLYELDIDNK